MTPDAGDRLDVPRETSGAGSTSGRGAGASVRIGGRAAFATITLLAFLVRLPTLTQPLVEAHAFRQTQTAYTALIYHRDGINLFQTPLPIAGPPWAVPFEFPLYQAIAALVMDAGGAADFALRVTSLAFFVLSTAVLFAIVRVELGPRMAWPVLAAFVVAPLGLLWSRASLMETLAVAASLGSVLELLCWDRSGSRHDLAIAIGLAMLAALVKITTAFVWLVPALVLIRRSRRGAALVVGVGMAAGLAWTTYADGIKAAVPATARLTSSALRDWNFGTMAERLDPGSWIAIGTWAIGLLGIVVLLSPRTIVSSRLARWATATLVIAPACFTNLFVQHDYYWMAVAPAAAILVGVAARRLMDLERRAVVLVGLTVVVVVSFVAYPRWTRAFMPYDEAGTLALAAEIDATTTPAALVAIHGRDWSPAVLYYADRRGFMEWPGAPIAPAGYVRFECPAEGVPGDCVRTGTSDGISP